jgi:hypothetical protein
MSTAARMQKIESALSALGVVDVKIVFGEEARSQRPGLVRQSVCRMLEAYLAGQYTRMAPIGDALIRARN